MKTQVERTARRAVAAALTSWHGDEAGLVALRTLRGPARGLRFRLSLAGQSEFGYWLGRYDRAVLRHLTRICRPGWTVWDCGTYLGYYTCVFARLVGPGGRVVAIEPDPANLTRTRQNAELNGFSNISFEPAAICGASGTSDFIAGAYTLSHLSGTYVGCAPSAAAGAGATGPSVRVRCLTLDDAWLTAGLPKPDAIKLDIEGAEGAALAGSRRLWHEVRPVVVVELHNPACDRAAWDWSRAWDYQLMRLDPPRPLTRPEDVGGTVLCLPA